MKTFHEVDPKGSLYFLLNGLNGALNKIGDALMRASGNNEQLARVEKKVDQILEAIKTDPEALKQLQAKISSLTDTLEGAVNNQQPSKQRRIKNNG